MVNESDETMPNQESEKRWNFRLRYRIPCIIAILLMLLYFGFFHLSSRDKYAFDMLTTNAYEFKDPESVKVLSGTAKGGDESYAFMCISSNNSYGVAVTGYYAFYPDRISDVSYSESLMKFCKEDSLNTSKINLRYRLYWIFK